jgi:RecB family exonuclease
MLLTRASQQLILLHPRTNSKGDPVFPSPLLTLDPKPASPVQIATSPTLFNASPPHLHRNYRQPRPWSASEFETYLACPWKHFASRGLQLQPLPETPAERLNPILLGNVAHQSIKLWTQDPSREIESIGERELERECRKVRAPFGYNYERERINLLRHLRLYAKNAPPIPPGWQAFLEQPFQIELNGGPAVRGQIDRYDQSPSGEIHAYDYKYSKANNLDEKYPIQGALYAIALGPDVTSFSYVALRDQSRPTPIEGDNLRNSITLARQEITRIVEAVSAGLIPVEPSQRDNCQYCDFMDACRIRTRTVDEEEAPLAEGAEA